jgi:hypothetical protein
MKKKNISAIIAIAVLATSTVHAQNKVHLLDSTKVKFDNFYGGENKKTASYASEQGVNVVWSYNTNQNAPISSGGFLVNLDAPLDAKDASLEIVAKGSNETGEKLNNMVVTLIDAEKKRCGRYTKSVGVDETPVSIKIVEMDNSDPDFTGDLSQVSQISISFVAKQGEGGNAFVSEANLILP